MSKSALSQRSTHWANSSVSIFIVTPISASCACTSCAMSFAYAGSVVCVSIVNETGPTFASVRSCFALATSRVYSGYCDVGSA